MLELSVELIHQSLLKLAFGGTMAQIMHGETCGDKPHHKLFNGI
jgi:hypothetical protein